MAHLLTGLRVRQTQFLKGFVLRTRELARTSDSSRVPPARTTTRVTRSHSAGARERQGVLRVRAPRDHSLRSLLRRHGARSRELRRLRRSLWCSLSCPEPLVNCNGVCIYTNTDRTHCGATDGCGV